ncbi:MAG: 1-acyl-sn-glycerol-3-phosphate acyltransferase [Spirochaetia bacterium]|nr:1-acyl-sn-glycerol-3-phosphate acyltransferase [Spirochaetia bacterium]
MAKVYPEHPGKGRFASWLLYIVSRIGVKFFYKIHTEGFENLPKTGPVLLLAKHQRVDDIPIGFSLIHQKVRKDVWCVMKDAMAATYFFGFFLRTGGLPINRKNPEKSKKSLLLGRHMLHEGRIVVIFPEQTTFPDKMGKGRTPGFRFLAGRPKNPIHVGVLGFRYKKAFPRTHVFVRVGKGAPYDIHEDPDHFLHDRMHEMAELSLLTYPYERPEGRKSVSDDELE